MGKLMYQGENLTGAPPLLGSLKDVNITSPSNNDALVYNSITQKWENGAGGGGSLDIVPKTQAEYNALTPEQKADPTKVYDITDANLVNADIDDTTTSVGKVWSSSKTSSEIQGAGLIHKTQEEYDALPSADKSDPTKHYLITNATLSGAPLDDSSISNGKVWSSQKIDNMYRCRIYRGLEDLSLDESALTMDIVDAMDNHSMLITNIFNYNSALAQEIGATSNGSTFIIIKGGDRDRVFGICSVYNENKFAWFNETSGVTPVWRWNISEIEEQLIPITSDNSGNANLNLPVSSYRIISIAQSASTFNGVVNLYSYGGKHYVHLSNWDGSAAKKTSATIRVTYINQACIKQISSS